MFYKTYVIISTNGNVPINKGAIEYQTKMTVNELDTSLEIIDDATRDLCNELDIKDFHGKVSLTKDVIESYYKSRFEIFQVSCKLITEDVAYKDFFPFKSANSKKEEMVDTAERFIYRYLTRYKKYFDRPILLIDESETMQSYDLDSLLAEYLEKDQMLYVRGLCIASSDDDDWIEF